jgi:serine protease AprX
VPAAPAQAAAPVSASLARAIAAGGGAIGVFVHGTTIAAARRAVADTGLQLVTTWNKVGVAIARGTAAQIAVVRTRPGVTYVEGDQPLRLSLSTSNVATRGEQARSQLRDTQGQPVDGRGVSAAVIDTGVDGTHPFFRNADGSSAVALNLKN